jgi:glycosyltransferase involved in cell wall biosynthesis
VKVIHIFHSLKFSGAEIMYVDAASFFYSKGCDLTAMATSEELGEYAPYFKNAGFKVEHQIMPPLKNIKSRIKYYIKIIKLLRNGKYDVVHIHSSGARWGFAFCAWIVRIKSVYTFHAIFPTRFHTYPYHFILRWSVKYIFKCSFQSISDSVHDHELKLYHNKTTKIYNWFNDKRYFPAQVNEKLEMRNELGIDKETFVIISVGGCNNNKRHSDIIKALPLISAKIPNYLYIHLGKGVTESHEVKLANDLGVEDHIRFYGNQDNVRNFLIASDIYLMTSRFEGISITTIEAMACGIPAILYDVQGLRDFNKFGNNSILIHENYFTLANAVITLQTKNAERVEMAKRAKEAVHQIFNLEKNAEKIYNLYL